MEESIVLDEFIEHIDLAATTLQLACLNIPTWMLGRPLFGPEAKPREYAVAARDRCDETVDRIRGIRKGDFKHIRNFYPQGPYLQPCVYKDEKPFMKQLREIYPAGKLNEAQSLLLAETRPEEELYDLSADPFEIHNLAAYPAQRERLSDFGKASSFSASDEAITTERQALGEWQNRVLEPSSR